VGEHHAFGFAGAAAGKNNGREIVERLGFPGVERAFEQRAGQKPEQQGSDFFCQARAGGDFFQQDLFTGDLQRKFFEQ
jgi:hypothetical protein